MRVRVLALLGVSVSVLVRAGAAAAQSDMMPMGPPSNMAHEQFTGQFPPAPSRHDRYVMKLLTLRDKTLKIKAKDGGQLTPEHAASLQHELDELNRQFGIKAAG